MFLDCAVVSLQSLAGKRSLKVFETRISRVENGRFSAVNRKTKYIIGFKPLYNHSGDDSTEDPPVPIPNTEVKLCYARSSWVLTPQDKVVAGFQKYKHSLCGCFIFLNAQINSAGISQRLPPKTHLNNLKVALSSLSRRL